MNYKVDVCVVGAGPGGALLAYLLAKKNVSVLLLEQHSAVGKAFRGEHLNEEGEAILKEHGLFEKIEQLGLLRMEKLEYWHKGEPFKTILPDPQVGHLGIHVPQKHLLSILLEAGEAYPAFQSMMNTRVVELLKDDAGFYNGVRAVKDGEEIFIESQLIIGADGRYSTVRKKAEIDVTIRKHGFDLLWARIPAPADWEPSIRMALIDGKQLSLFTQAQGFIQIGWNIEEGSFPQLRKQPFTPFIDQLTEAFPQLEETVHNHIQSWKDFVLLDVYSSTSESWGKNGVALIGDAVHTMTPTGAFGLNSALKDADFLASLIDQNYISQLNYMECANARKKEVENLQEIQVEKEQAFASNFVVVV
ncbi:FAD-dependent monooxygenase [Psychrobacillus lasiicapitis]|uniref:FAD-binding protein n=1 Tax=Psychrobacillus lasiicapitis TaxID=1636719 RepID=A0A544SWR8_9BACI|nr:FAD-dependent monooxygenase [Psychrobacillus lasiicapitis]TQR09607.1 FAD-binding protein [Psychrobacillus lasiicapitis]GGA29052.1 FAD-dependent oxidoreductase [Psychrobacillus lasiicapitis]